MTNDEAIQKHEFQMRAKAAFMLVTIYSHMVPGDDWEEIEERKQIENLIET